MRIPSLASRFNKRTWPGEWPWWQLPPGLRCYVAAPAVMALAGIGLLAPSAKWSAEDLGKFALIACCGMISVASTPRIMYATGGVTRDFSTVWVLPTAILLPPVYSILMPIPMLIVMQFWVHPGVVHRRIFTAATIGITYAVASIVFREISRGFAGHDVGSGIHAFTWVVAVLGCEILAGRCQHFLIVGAVKLTDPTVRIWKIEWDREALQGLAVETDLGVLITLVIALSPALVILALPTVILVRRFLVHPILLAQSRVDSKTGLLNVSTWEEEAESELSRSVRMQNAMSVALVDIDHFKAVNDTYGHLVGDRVLKALADTLTGHMRDYDKAGRFGGEEFVLLLAQATEGEACRIAERLRLHVSEMEVPVSDNPGAACVRLTVSIGVTSMAAGSARELSDMLAAADSALYRAKQTGRNKVCVARYGLDAELEHGFVGSTVKSSVESVGTDPAGASLGLGALLSAHSAIRGVLQPFARYERGIRFSSSGRRSTVRLPGSSGSPGRWWSPGERWRPACWPWPRSRSGAPR